MNKPQVLILDEPTAGLNPTARNEVRAVLGDLPAETITIFSTHLVDDVSQLSGHVIALNKGTVAFDGTWPELVTFTESNKTPHHSTDPLEAALYLLSSKAA